MRNIKNLFAAAMALVSMSSTAVVFQPGTPVSEDAPIRVSTGVGTTLVKTKALGVDNIGVGLGLTHNVGYDFEYGLALGAGYAKPMSGRLFTDDLDKSQGVGMNVEAMFRFLPEVCEGLRLGGRVNIGWDGHFGGKDNADYKKASEAVKFGDLNVRVGVAMNWSMSDMASLYISPAVAFNNIRMLDDAKATDALKKGTNVIGAEAAVGGMFAASENLGVYVETTPKFVNFKDNGFGFREDFVAGVTFAM